MLTGRHGNRDAKTSVNKLVHNERATKGVCYCPDDPTELCKLSSFQKHHNNGPICCQFRFSSSVPVSNYNNCFSPATEIKRFYAKLCL